VRGLSGPVPFIVLWVLWCALAALTFPRCALGLTSTERAQALEGVGSELVEWLATRQPRTVHPPDGKPSEEPASGKLRRLARGLRKGSASSASPEGIVALLLERAARARERIRPRLVRRAAQVCHASASLLRPRKALSSSDGTAVRTTLKRLDEERVETFGLIRRFYKLVVKVRKWLWSLLGTRRLGPGVDFIRLLRNLVVYGLAIGCGVVACVALFTFFRAFGRAMSLSREYSSYGSDLGEGPAGSRGFQEEARRARDDGEYGRALQFLFLDLIERLDRRGVVRFDPARTNQEYCRAVRRKPGLSAGLREMAGTLDRYLFGGNAPDADEYRRCLARFDESVETLSSQDQEERS